MAKQHPEIIPQLQDFIEAQKVFFVGTAAPSGRVNVSPKGMDSLRVLSPSQVVWLNLTGSGNETAAHLLQDDRMTIMFCAFEGSPMILRLYGHAKAYHPEDEAYESHLERFPNFVGSRQIMVMDVDLVQTSCGMAVPLLQFQEERDLLTDWADQKGRSGIEAYWQKKNKSSIDGFDTGMG